VRRWNRASLGEGYEAARLDAFKGISALMLRFPDGACGLVFPRAAVERKPMVNFLDGNYQMTWSPLGFVLPSDIAALQADADRQANVFVRKSDGRVLARPHTRIFVAPEDVFRNEPGCVRFIDPHYSVTARYEVLKTSVSCIVVRTLGWAWPAREESAEHADRPTSRMHIIGWQCVGTELIHGLTPVTYEKLTCIRHSDVVELKDLARQAIFQPPPSRG
jgi:hypothetical protein